MSRDCIHDDACGFVATHAASLSLAGSCAVLVLTNSFPCSPAGLSNRASPLTRINADRFAINLGVGFIRQAKALGNAQR